MKVEKVAVEGREGRRRLNLKKRREEKVKLEEEMGGEG